MSDLPPPPAAPGAPVAGPRPKSEPESSLIELEPAPRAGELTLGWRVGTAIAWIGVVLAFAAVWNASVQLGLSTWWLGPRGEPRSHLVRLVPFVPSVFMVLGTINNARWLGRWGLLASGVLAAVGFGDLDRVGSIAATELAIAAAAAVISVASLTGTYLPPATDA